MAYTFNVISLGVLADIDTVEGNYTTENAAALQGLTFGGVNNALVNNFVSFTFASGLPISGGRYFYDTSNGVASGTGISSQFSINGGAPQTFDGVAVYNATITYTDGTTATVTATLFQDIAGNAYIAPELDPNLGLPLPADQVAFEAKPIRSITLNSVNQNTLINLDAFRYTWNHLLCFAAGTMIDTPDGPVAVETLRAGDMVTTLDNGAQPLRWTGRTTVSAKGDFAPVVIAKGALGNTRDLVVSPQHRVLLSGWRAELLFGEPEVLCAAVHLVNGDTIYRREGGEVEYVHIMFDSHEIVFSEGAATESFHPGEQAMAALPEATRKEILTLFPELASGTGQMRETCRTSLKSFEAQAFAG